MKFNSKKPHYEFLRKTWLNKHKNLQQKIWDKHGQALKQLAVGSLGSLMILSSPLHSQHTASSNLATSKEGILEGFDQNILLAQQLKDKIPQEVRVLDPRETDEILQILSKDFGFRVTDELDGIRLNRNYGFIGGEQHLYRYPGDNLYAHADSTIDFAKYGSAGIAPGLGAWGYFASSKSDFKDIDKEREKYYLAIQTFLSPGFAENVEKYRDSFKFRKMLVVNPKSGQTVVAVIGDAGPADWTGKHLGGSPEVMDALGLAEGSRKGPVLYFFIDDSKDQVPLGPVKVQSQV